MKDTPTGYCCYPTATCSFASQNLTWSLPPPLSQSKIILQSHEICPSWCQTLNLHLNKWRSSTRIWTTSWWIRPFWMVCKEYFYYFHHFSAPLGVIKWVELKDQWSGWAMSQHGSLFYSLQSLPWLLLMVSWTLFSSFSSSTIEQALKYFILQVG